MKKLCSWLLMSALLLSAFSIPAALADGYGAEYISGTADTAKTFYVTATRSNATLEIYSFRGLARVRRQTTEEDVWQHGAYTVTQTGGGVNRSFVWIPAATAQAGSAFESLMLSFPSAGQYTVTLEPLWVAEPYSTWHTGALTGWVYAAAWNVTNLTNCSCANAAYVPPTAPPTNPPTARPYVPTAVPRSIVTSAPAQLPPKVEPAGWDTYFRPETCSTDNSSGINRLDLIHDGKPGTVFYYLIWTSEWKNRYAQPQFYAFFDNGSISGMGMINGSAGSPESYRENARVRTMMVVVHSAAGDETFEFNVADNFSTSYQYFSFGRTITGVTQVDIHILGSYNDAPNRNLICISDMCFFQ